jgi:hypothetical protein
MAAAAIDSYLLDGKPSKARVVEEVLRSRSDEARAQPFYRAFEAIGPRAADEALIALRLILAGVPPEDDYIRRVRELVSVVRAGGPEAEAARAEYARFTRSPDDDSS